MKKLSMTTLCAIGLIVCAASLTAEGGAKSGNEAAPADTTYTVRGVNFTMKGIAAVTNGSVGHDDERNNKPHTISLSAYLIGETEVTQELWQAVMGNKKWFEDILDTSPGMGEVQGKRPVEQVSWFDCIVFCNELTKKVTELGASQCVYYRDAACNAVYTATNADNGTVPYVKQGAKGFRLPTEAEWEWAAKGGTENRWAGTNEEDELNSYAWYDAKNYAWYETYTDQKTHAVKRKRPNGYGLYDMSGNVWEWCWDRYEDRTPSGGQRDPVSATSGSRCVIRGGSWLHNAACATRAYRGSRSPWYSNCFLGLRLACSVHTARNPVGAGEVILGISSYEKDIHIMAVTADGSPIQVEGCTDTELPSGEERFLTATGDTVVLKGMITKLDCGGNQLTSLDIRGLTALRELYCWDNQLTALNLKGLSALEVLRCEDNQLTSLNVKDLTSLQFITCNNNRLTSLDIQGVRRLSKLYCYRNRLKEQALIRILNNLPAHKSDEEDEAVFYTEEDDRQPEENSMDFTSSAGLKAAMERAMEKNWTLYKQDGEGDFEEIDVTE